MLINNRKATQNKLCIQKYNPQETSSSTIYYFDSSHFSQEQKH